MKPTHIISGSTSSFGKKINQLVAQRDVALHLKNIQLSGTGITAVVEEQPAVKSAPGSLLEVRVEEVDAKSAPEFTETLAAANPNWSIAAAAAGKGKDLIVVAILVQP